MRKILIVLSIIVLVQFLGCASPRHSTLVVIAEGRVASHTVYKPDISGLDAYERADAVVRAEYHVILP